MKMKLSNSPDFPTPKSPKSTMLYSGEGFPPVRRPLITMSEKYSSLRMKKFYASVSFWWYQGASSYIIKNNKIRRTIYFITWAKHRWMPWAQMSESLHTMVSEYLASVKNDRTTLLQEQRAIQSVTTTLRPTVMQYEQKFDYWHLIISCTVR